VVLGAVRNLASLVVMKYKTYTCWMEKEETHARAKYYSGNLCVGF
jgi:hypothetical protein